MKYYLKSFILIFFSSLCFSQISSNGLVAFWPFNGNAIDSTGNGYNGMVDGASLVSDRFGNPNSAYYFNGTNSRISTNFPGITGKQERTISLWIKTNLSQSSVIFYYGMPDIHIGESLFLATEGLDAIGPKIDWASRLYQIIYPDNYWKHLTFVLPNLPNPTISDIKVYCDGIQVTRLKTSISDGIINTQRSINFSIGYYPPLGNKYFNGCIDDIRIYNRALSEPEIIALANEKEYYTISGTILFGLSRLSGVKVTLSGNKDSVMITGFDGSYRFTAKSEGNYLITPSKANYYFNPVNHTILNIGGNRKINFNAYQNLITLSGVIKSSGINQSNVNVTLSGGKDSIFTTGIDGFYSFTVPTGRDYTITPSKINHTFDPAAQKFNYPVGDNTQNFEAGLKNYTIKGMVVFDTTKIEGATITMSGSKNGSVTTDPYGNYSFLVEGGGTYTINANKSNYSFKPEHQTFSEISADQTLDFISGTQLFTIDGIIKCGESSIPNAVVKLSGSLNGISTTDSSGHYLLNVIAGGTYNITAEKVNYTFDPQNRTYMMLWNNHFQDFTANLNTYILSGTLKLGLSGQSGVTVNLNGGAGQSVITDANGNFSFSVPGGNNYTVTPDKNHYKFNPSERKYNLLSDNKYNLSFESNYKTYTIDGKVIGAKNIPVYLSGYKSDNTITDLSGSFSFYVDALGQYTVTPEHIDYAFVPLSKTFLNLISSQSQNFNATIKIPDQAYLILPVDDAKSVSFTPVLSWGLDYSAISYDLQISVDPGFDIGFMLFSVNVAENKYVVNNLDYNKKYYWRVRGRNSNGPGTWSLPRSFYTQQAPLKAPNLLFPVNDSRTYQTHIVISWSSVEFSAEYLYQISEEITFSNVLFSIRTKDTTNLVNGLDKNKKYYWRVRAENGDNFSPWSEIWSIVVISFPPAIPELKTPLNNSSVKIDNQKPVVSLEWNLSDNAIDYLIQVAENRSFSSILKEENGYISNKYNFTVKNNIRYYWRVKANSAFESSQWSDVRSFSSVFVNIEKVNNVIPDSYSLKQNYPNPFNPQTQIEYSLPENTYVLIKIYDSSGKEVGILQNGKQNAGIYLLNWEPKNLSNGIYYIKFLAGRYVEVRKMLYLR